MGKSIRVSKLNTHVSIWEGDWDKDGVKNIDDRYPFDKSRSQLVNKEVELAKRWRNLKRRRRVYKEKIKVLARKIGAQEHRVKDMYSVIGKQMGRNIVHVQDFGGLRVFSKNRASAHRRWSQFNERHHTTDMEDHYERASPANPYMAFHSTVWVGRKPHRKPFEVQFKTRAQQKLHDEMHPHYKAGNVKILRKFFVKAKNLP